MAAASSDLYAKTGYHIVSAGGQGKGPRTFIKAIQEGLVRDDEFCIVK